MGLELAPASWATVEVDVDGSVLTDFDTDVQRSLRRAVRRTFNELGTRSIVLVAHGAAGIVS